MHHLHPTSIQCQEKLWNVKMNSDDYNFYENQKLIPQVGFCQSFVDRKRRISHKNKQEKGCYKRINQTYENDSSWNVDTLTEYGQDVIASITASATESDCSVCSESSEYKTFAKKTKYQYNKTFPVYEQEDDIPLQYRHVGNSERNVKTEVYEVIAKLKRSITCLKHRLKHTLVS